VNARAPTAGALVDRPRGNEGLPAIRRLPDTAARGGDVNGVAVRIDRDVEQAPADGLGTEEAPRRLCTWCSHACEVAHALRVSGGAGELRDADAAAVQARVSSHSSGGPSFSSSGSHARIRAFRRREPAFTRCAQPPPCPESSPVIAAANTPAVAITPNIIAICKVDAPSPRVKFPEDGEGISLQIAALVQCRCAS
jgi:hypothetical protein